MRNPDGEQRTETPCGGSEMGIGDTELPGGLSVREWCRQWGVTPTTYDRWEREVLSGIGRKDAGGHSGTAFVELRGPQPLENVSECIETLNIGGESIDLYQEMGPELLRTLVELLRR